MPHTPITALEFPATTESRSYSTQWMLRLHKEGQEITLIPERMDMLTWEREIPSYTPCEGYDPGSILVLIITLHRVFRTASETRGYLNCISRPDGYLLTAKKEGLWKSCWLL